MQERVLNMIIILIYSNANTLYKEPLRKYTIGMIVYAQQKKFKGKPIQHLKSIQEDGPTKVTTSKQTYNCISNSISTNSI